MGKTQKSVSVPKEYMDEIVKLYKEHQEEYKVLGITSESKLVMVLANFGKQPLEQLLSVISKLSNHQVAAMKDTIANLDKYHKMKPQNNRES